MKYIIFSMALLSAASCYATSLEDLFNGFERCSIKGAYYDIQSAKAPNPYFEERKLKPYKLEGSLAFYSVQDTFYGIPVSEVIIPVTFDMHILIFDMPLSKVSNILQEKFNISFEPSEDIDNGNAPGLHADKTDKYKTVLYCEDKEVNGGEPSL